MGSEDDLSLSYDSDLMHVPGIGFRKIMEFADLPAQGVPRTTLKRTNPYLVRDVVEDFEDLEDELKGTESERMLYE